MKNVENYPTIAFETQQDWEMWLEKHQSEAKGVWLKLAKKATGIPSMTHAEALDGALCYGWIEVSRPVESRADLELATLVKQTPKNNVSERRQANADETAPLSA